jgi:hypothetical protein
MLVEAGADVNAEDGHGYTPHDLATAAAPQERAPSAGPPITTGNRSEESSSAPSASDGEPSQITGQDSSELDVADYLVDRGATPRDITVSAPPPLAPPVGGLLVLLGCFAPFFAHLWFLWHLCWLILAFVIIVYLARRLGWKRLPARFVALPVCLLWLLPLTLLAQMGMVQAFGPDTSAGLVPWPPVLAYYAIFFGFGALVYGNRDVEQGLGRHWKMWLLLAVTALPLGIWLFETRPGGDMLTIIDFGSSPIALLRSDLDLPRHALTSLCAVVYCWSMVFACIGLFRRYFSGENRRIRYVSDSAYWLYLAHLPLIQLMQVLVWDWPISGILKITLVSFITTALLLIVYQYCVRYTWIGTMLNGKRTRAGRVEAAPT